MVFRSAHGRPALVLAVDVRLVRCRHHRSRHTGVLCCLGALGQLLALLVFVYLGLASSGGTISLQALGGFFRFVANFEPLRQIVAAVRAILYFNATGDAGLNRALVLAAIGLVLWVVAGAAITLWYDKRGFDRVPMTTPTHEVTVTPVAIAEACHE